MRRWANFLARPSVKSLSSVTDFIRPGLDTGPFHFLYNAISAIKPASWGYRV
jgi:hypothetical protein